jgi:hypothetical protein
MHPAPTQSVTNGSPLAYGWVAPHPYNAARMKPAVESARRDWEDGYRRFLAETGDPGRADALHRQLDEVVDELRRRLGSRFTLPELEETYRSSDTWVRVTVAEHAPSRGWERNLSTVADAAFHLYSRGAVDFEP